MTDASDWRAHVLAMIEQAQAHQDELFYRCTLPLWLRELGSLERGEAQAHETPEHTTSIQGVHTS